MHNWKMPEGINELTRSFKDADDVSTHTVASSCRRPSFTGPHLLRGLLCCLSHSSTPPLLPPTCSWNYGHVLASPPGASAGGDPSTSLSTECKRESDVGSGDMPFLLG